MPTLCNLLQRQGLKRRFSEEAQNERKYVFAASLSKRPLIRTIDMNHIKNLLPNKGAEQIDRFAGRENQFRKLFQSPQIAAVTPAPWMLTKSVLPSLVCAYLM